MMLALTKTQSRAVLAVTREACLQSYIVLIYARQANLVDTIVLLIWYLAYVVFLGYNDFCMVSYPWEHAQTTASWLGLFSQRHNLSCSFVR